jgi:hypothetical protein
MAIVFEEFTEARAAAVREFNTRLAAALDEDMRFPEHPLLDWLPKGSHPAIYQEAFLAMEGVAVRGGYVLKHQEFALQGSNHKIASYRLPISEGIVNRAYVSLGMSMLRHALARQPMLFSLGMGSLDHPVAKMQKAMGWRQYLVPFYYKPVHGGRFCRNIVSLRRGAVRKSLLDLAAWSGIASLGTAVWQIMRPARIGLGVRVEAFRGFTSWSDEIWERVKAEYSLIAVRNSEIANALYPASNPRFLCWKISRASEVLGWAVCLDTSLRGHRQFGDMRLGTIVDGLASPRNARILLAAAARELERRGVDLIVSNQAHTQWGAGLRAAGFLPGPSNFIFSASPQLSEAIAPFDAGVQEAHINRGDGDGPIHL